VSVDLDDAERIAREVLVNCAASDVTGIRGVSLVLAELGPAEGAAVRYQEWRLTGALIRELGRIYNLTPAQVLDLIELDPDLDG
jgi:hypothetical protein